MKILNAVFLCCLLAGAQASFLDSLKDAFSNLGQGVLAAGAVVGNQLLDQLKDTSLTLASTAVGQLVDQLDQVAETGKKRDIDNILKEVAPILQELEDSVGQHSFAQKIAFTIAIKQLENQASKMADQDNTTLGEFLNKIDSIVGNHSMIADLLMKEVETKMANMTSHKRSLVDSLGQVGNSLSGVFSPQIESLKSIVSSVGDALKQAAAGLFSSLTQSVQQLGPALAPHTSAMQQSGQAILGEGQNAIDSLKDAVGSIFQQTLTNIQPHVNNIVNHGTQALGAAAGQLLTNMIDNELTGNSQ